MAYAAVASVSETIDIVLKYHRDSSLSREFEDQMKSVQKHSVFFGSFLEEFRERGNNWDETIREVTDRAEEIIELLLSDLLAVEIEKTTSGGSRSRSSSSSSSKCELVKGKSSCEVICNSRLGDLERVIEEMESIIKKIKGKHSEAAGGADVELMEIIRRLLTSASREVIAIVGMKGMGKAALAKKAFHHPYIVKYFHIRAWCTISPDYSPREIILELLRCMKLAWPYETISRSDDEVMLNLHENLGGRRYLIVLNDMRSIEAWDKLRYYFPDNANGSRIILTTRDTDLCRAARASYIHQIRLLDEDRAWNVVRENVFGGDPCPSQLESVGKMIAGSCGGHPLCIQVVSRMLAAADHTLAAWDDILQNMNINANEDDDSYLMNVLDLSYTYLPHHLKPCFLYFGCFPEGHEIRVSRLVKLWVAEGFVSENNIGEERVEDLVRRGLLSVTGTKSNGSTIKSVAIHDLVRDVCLRRAPIDNFSYAGHGGRYVELLWCRRVTTSDDDEWRDIVEGVYGSIIRTIILSSDEARLPFVIRSIGSLRLLRVLDLLNVYYVDDLAGQVCELFHLRYLAFRCRSRLSAAISNLQNLQTLIIRQLGKSDVRILFHNFADGIWRMPQLRHLFVFHLTVPAQIRAMSSALEDLQTLSRVVNFICSRDNLKFIPNLKKLDLLYYPKGDVVVQQDYELHNLIYLHKLQTLKILMNWFSVGDYKMRFGFPPSLNKLNLCGLRLPWEDMKSTVATLPNLQVLKLRRDSFIGDTWETSEGGFSQLIYLLIQDSNLVFWETKTSHVPKLKQLVLRRCPSMYWLPYGIGKIQTLELIELDRKNRHLLRSANRIDEARQSLGDDRLHIRVV